MTTRIIISNRVKKWLESMLGLIVTVSPFLLAQQVHQLPFASANNTIALAIHNSSGVTVTGVKVEATNAPSWIRLTSTEQTIKQLKEKGDAVAAFSFSVDKLAPANKPEALAFTITTSSGEKWTKRISIVVNPPDHFELFQNYPNPFNPATTISYLLPKDTRVVLKIYNSIGQEVTTLVNDDRPAGYHQEIWTASAVASGMYIYQLAFVNEHSTKEFYRKKMLVVR